MSQAPTGFTTPLAEGAGKLDRRCCPFAAPCRLLGCCCLLGGLAVLDRCSSLQWARDRRPHHRFGNRQQDRPQPGFLGAQSEILREGCSRDCTLLTRGDRESYGSPKLTRILPPVIWFVSILKMTLTSHMDWIVIVGASFVLCFLLRLVGATFFSTYHNHVVSGGGVLVRAFRSVFNVGCSHVQLPISLETG